MSEPATGAVKDIGATSPSAIERKPWRPDDNVVYPITIYIAR